MSESLRNLSTIEYGASPKEIRSQDYTPISIYGTGGLVGFSNKVLFYGPLVVVARKGTLDNPLYVAENCWVIDTAYAVLPKQDVDAKWLYYNLLNYDLKSLNESTGVPSISRDYLYRVKFIKFTLPEQRRIAHILSTVDEVIEKTEVTIAKYKAIKAGMMHDLFTRGIDVATGKLRPTYEEAPGLYWKSELGWVPREWEVNSINHFNIQIVDGDRGTNYPHENELFEHGYCLFLNASNVTKDGFAFSNNMYITENKEKLLGSGKLERNDVIITTRGTVGNIAIYSDDIKYEHMRINSGMLILRNREQGMISDFLFQSFRNYLFDIDFKRVVSGSAQPQLPMKDLKGFRLIKPNEVEQTKIVNICKRHDNLIKTEIEALEKLKYLKHGLMSDLLTGKVPVKYEENIVEVVS